LAQVGSGGEGMMRGEGSGEEVMLAKGEEMLVVGELHVVVEEIAFLIKG